MNPIGLLLKTAFGAANRQFMTVLQVLPRWVFNLLDPIQSAGMLPEFQILILLGMLCSVNPNGANENPLQKELRLS